MRTSFVWGCLLAALLEPCTSDMYMHFPPGSNNRLNGNQDNVRNANRLFDSQVSPSQSGTQRSQASWSAGGCRERLWDTGTLTAEFLRLTVLSFVTANSQSQGYEIDR